MFWILKILFLPACVYGIGQPHYECGEHGRFEYCIDGIPGCIVGCHCHPGYYFDTESKICEPNAKLVHEYRRLFSGVEPTRVPDLFGQHDPSNFLYRNVTTVNPIDAHVDKIAKESDDLGDWLYNQFFKTIESQVINNTDDTAASTKPPTRRSGFGGPKFPSKKPKRKKKKGKNIENKKNKKKGDLRRKLLRITEDDSLFDDSSSGSSGGSSYSGSSSDDSSSGTSASHEKDDTKDKEKDDKEHGHRKILMFNKKPKPPLPSFIFMPHAFHTPFFPPIGLPPPPVPMYPMVPVPPMPIPPIFPLPLPKNCSDKPNENTTQKPNGDTAKNATEAHNETAQNDTGGNNPPPDNNLPPDNSTQVDNNVPANNTMLLRSFLRSGKHGQQKKILRQIQEHMKFPKKSISKKIRMKPRDNLPDIDTDYESPLLDSAFPLPQVQPTPVVREPPAEDVDFKYLAQLIHKMDNKGHKKTVTSEANKSHRKQANLVNQLFTMPVAEEPTRRNFNNRRFLEAPDETYYSKLGHQIATLIRRIDGGDHRDNPEGSPQPQPQPVFSENSHAPRSYWERSVRSLLKRFSPSADEYYGQRNYEENLFNLESKIETIASTVKPLSLNELENVVFLIDKSKARLQSQPIINHISSTTTKGYEDDNLNINLLPRNYNPKVQQKLFEFLTGTTGDVVKNNTHAINRYETAVYNSNNINNFIAPNLKNTQNQLRGVLMHNFRNAPTVDYRNINQNQINAIQRRNMTYYHNNRNFNMANIANLQKMVDAKLKSEAANSRNRLPRVPWLAPKIASLIENQKNSMLPEQLLTQQLLPQQVNLKYQNHPNNKNNFKPRYYVDNTNRHSHHKGIPVPIRVQIKPTHLKVAPSYFHHELQHFDFFDK